MDWKDALSQMASQFDSSSSDDESGVNSAQDDGNRHIPEVKGYSYADLQKERVHVLKERKGRAGKVATIIEGFSCDEETLREIAGKLKKRLGTGGSARGGEILIQGDVVDKVKTYLNEMGIKTKG